MSQHQKIRKIQNTNDGEITEIIKHPLEVQICNITYVTNTNT